MHRSSPPPIPTFAHYLRLAGYRTCLSGKMHFVGPDQLHGFEDRVTTDMYPGDFGWTPTWEDPKRIHWWFHNMLSVTEAGPYDRSLEMEHDEEVAYTSRRWLHDHARGNDQRPFMMCISFMQPHDPYLGPRADYESYREDEIDMPVVPYVAPAKREAVGKRMYDLYDRDEFSVTERHIRAARRGYYAMITYSDRLLGQVMRTLEETGQADNTIIVVSADHGDMLGERGLWYKMTFFEHSTRVPMIVHAPKALKARRVAEHVSLMDLLPTFCDIATDGKGVGYAAPVDGNSLLGLAAGSKKGWSDTVFGEYMAEGTFQPAFMIRRDRWKYVSCAGRSTAAVRCLGRSARAEEPGRRSEARPDRARVRGRSRGQVGQRRHPRSGDRKPAQSHPGSGGAAEGQDHALGLPAVPGCLQAIQPQLRRGALRHRPARPHSPSAGTEERRQKVQIEPRPACQDQRFHVSIPREEAGRDSILRKRSSSSREGRAASARRSRRPARSLAGELY